MQLYTFICDFFAIDAQPLGQRFVIAARGLTFEKAKLRAAEAALIRYPELAETQTPATFWESEYGAVQLVALYGDHLTDIVDQSTYDIFDAETVLREHRRTSTE
ncbi:hypothetical protein [Streptomyces sp. NPDC047065]|uniref:hypothetical protein n=1 Tax=Streptomyces sp. NPDC047065 TaxID=3154606 RepID=UPI0033EA3187